MGLESQPLPPGFRKPAKAARKNPKSPKYLLMISGSFCILAAKAADTLKPNTRVDEI